MVIFLQHAQAGSSTVEDHFSALKRPKGVKGVGTLPASPAHHDPLRSSP